MASNRAAIASLPIDPHRLTVACPWRGVDTPYDECRRCERCWLVHLGQNPSGSFVVCERLPAAASARASSPAPVPEARDTVVSSIMTRSVVSVQPGLAIERLILLLIDEDIGAAPVVDEAGRLLGLVSRADLVTDDYDWADLRDDCISDLGASEPTEQDSLFLLELLRSRTVADVMTPNAVTLPSTASIAEAAAALATHHSPEAVVIDDRGGIAGVVSKSDIVRWIAGIPATRAMA